jgi:hypothetical protein
MHGHHHPEPSPYILVCELDADPKNASATAFAGHQGAWNLTVEYLVDQGAAKPEVAVSIVKDGATTKWHDSGAKPGFHHATLGPVAPGAKLSLNVTNLLARLRWCEPVCC